MDVTSLDVGHSTLLCYLGHCGLDGQTTIWVNNWLDHWAQRVVVSGSYSACRLERFHGCRGKVGIKIRVTAVGHMEPSRAQLGNTLSTLLGIWC